MSLKPHQIIKTKLHATLSTWYSLFPYDPHLCRLCRTPTGYQNTSLILFFVTTNLLDRLHFFQKNTNHLLLDRCHLSYPDPNDLL